MRPARRIHGAFFTLSIAAHPEPGKRYACVVSKKVATHAVDRNLVKRRCRHALRALVIPSRPLALVFSAKKSARDATYHEIAEDIKKLLNSAAH